MLTRMSKMLAGYSDKYYKISMSMIKTFYCSHNASKIQKINGRDGHGHDVKHHPNS